MNEWTSSVQVPRRAAEQSANVVFLARYAVQVASQLILTPVLLHLDEDNKHNQRQEDEASRERGDLLAGLPCLGWGTHC